METTSINTFATTSTTATTEIYEYEALQQIFDRLGVAYEEDVDDRGHEYYLATAFTCFVFDRNWRFLRQEQNSRIYVVRKT